MVVVVVLVVVVMVVFKWAAGCRGGSSIKSTYSSYSGPKFSLQHPWGLTTPAPGEFDALFWHEKSLHSHEQTHTQTHII